MSRTPQNERRMRSPLGVVSPNVPSNPASGAPKIGGSAVAALCAELVAPPHVGTHSRALAQLNHALQGSPGLARAHRSELLRLLPSVVAGPVHHDAAAICALLRGVLVHCGEAGGDAALDAALAASLTWLWSQPEARLLESVHAVLLRAHPQVAQRALALLLRCAAGGAAAACSEAQLLCAVQGVELVFAMWSDAALTGHARTLADALVAFASVGGGERVEEAWGRALQAAQQRGVSQPHGEWATLARSVAHACAHHPAARALVAADPIPLSTEAVAAAASNHNTGLTPTLAQLSLTPRKSVAPGGAPSGRRWSPASVGSAWSRVGSVGGAVARRLLSPFSPSSAAPARGVSLPPPPVASAVGAPPPPTSGFSVVTRLFSPSSGAPRVAAVAGRRAVLTGSKGRLPVSAIAATFATPPPKTLEGDLQTAWYDLVDAVSPAAAGAMRRRKRLALPLLIGANVLVVAAALLALSSSSSTPAAVVTPPLDTCAANHSRILRPPPVVRPRATARPVVAGAPLVAPSTKAAVAPPAIEIEVPMAAAAAAPSRLPPALIELAPVLPRELVAAPFDDTPAPAAIEVTITPPAPAVTVRLPPLRHIPRVVPLVVAPQFPNCPARCAVWQAARDFNSTAAPPPAAGCGGKPAAARPTPVAIAVALDAAELALTLDMTAELLAAHPPPTFTEPEPKCAANHSLLPTTRPRVSTARCSAGALATSMALVVAPSPPEPTAVRVSLPVSAGPTRLVATSPRAAPNSLALVTTGPAVSLKPRVTAPPAAATLGGATIVAFTSVVQPMPIRGAAPPAKNWAAIPLAAVHTAIAHAVHDAVHVHVHTAVHTAAKLWVEAAATYDEMEAMELLVFTDGAAEVDAVDDDEIDEAEEFAAAKAVLREAGLSFDALPSSRDLFFDESEAVGFFRKGASLCVAVGTLLALLTLAFAGYAAAEDAADDDEAPVTAAAPAEKVALSVVVESDDDEPLSARAERNGEVASPRMNSPRVSAMVARRAASPFSRPGAAGLLLSPKLPTCDLIKNLSMKTPGEGARFSPTTDCGVTSPLGVFTLKPPTPKKSPAKSPRRSPAREAKQPAEPVRRSRRNKE